MATVKDYPDVILSQKCHTRKSHCKMLRYSLNVNSLVYISRCDTIYIKGKMKEPLIATQYRELFNLHASDLQSHNQLLLVIKIRSEYILVCTCLNIFLQTHVPYYGLVRPKRVIYDITQMLRFFFVVHDFLTFPFINIKKITAKNTQRSTLTQLMFLNL